MPASDGFSLSGDAGVLLMSDGRPFSLKGITWEGAETAAGIPGGLDANSLSFYFSFLRRNKFNTVRLPFNHKSVRDNAAIPTSKVTPALNPALFADADSKLGVNYVEMLRQVALAAAEQNMLIVLAAGRLTPTSWPGDGLWYSREIPEALLPGLWSRLADALCDQWNVVGVDLHHGVLARALRSARHEQSSHFVLPFHLCSPRALVKHRAAQGNVGYRPRQSPMGRWSAAPWQPHPEPMLAVARHGRGYSPWRS